jgi:hypothetical protein
MAGKSADADSLASSLHEHREEVPSEAAREAVDVDARAIVQTFA